MRTRLSLCITVALVAVAPALAWVDYHCLPPNSPCYPKCGGQVNISGATLFETFFTVPASTNDWIDPDCDGTERIIDNLAPDYYLGFGNGSQDWWLVNYRGVGSGNGLSELVNYHCYGDIPTDRPIDNGYINRYRYFTGSTEIISNPWGCLDETDWASRGACCYGGTCARVTPAECATLGGTFMGLSTNCLPLSICTETDPNRFLGACIYFSGVGTDPHCALMTQSACANLTPPGTWQGPWTNCGPCYTGTPVVQESIDLAVMDVPTTWFVTVSGGTPSWDRNPREPGYGRNAVRSWDQNESNALKSLGCLNTNISAPDGRTVYDTPIAWVPIAFIANRGTGIGLGAAFPPNTANEGNITTSELQYIFATGRTPTGENLIACTRDAGSGTRNGAMSCIDLDPSWGRGDNVGKKADDSSQDLVGPKYVPCFKGGSSRIEGAVQNARLAIGYTGLYGSSRAIADAVEKRYEILNVKVTHRPRGPVNYVRPNLDSVLDNGDDNPDAWQIGGPETFVSVGDPQSGRPGHENNPPMAKQAAADYLNNITDSIAQFVAWVGDPNLASAAGTPGQYLALKYQLTAATDAVPDDNNPGVFIPNPYFNQTVQDFVRAYQGQQVTPAFGISAANKVPTRTVNPVWPTVTPCDCAYPPNGVYSDGSNAAYKNPHTLANIPSGDLNSRNRLSGDFNGDGVRNIDDIDYMLRAYYDRHVLNDPTYASYRSLPGVNSTPTNPVVPEIIGDFNADGNFDCRDIRYFCDGLALDPADGQLHRAAAFLRVDEVWFTLTGDDNFFNTTIYDCNGNPRPWVRGAAAADVAGNTPWPGAQPHGYDCRVDCTDAAYIDANFGVWSNLSDAARIDLSCDLTNDLVVDCDDALFVRGLMGGCVCPNLTNPCTGPVLCPGDTNCDGEVTFADIDPFVEALAGSSSWPYDPCPWLNADCNGDGDVTFADIDPFVALIGTQCP
jgi:hypothetical protein